LVLQLFDVRANDGAAEEGSSAVPGWVGAVGSPHAARASTPTVSPRLSGKGWVMNSPLRERT
jgi:hypothetical protein